MKKLGRLICTKEEEQLNTKICFPSICDEKTKKIFRFKLLFIMIITTVYLFVLPQVAFSQEKESNELEKWHIPDMPKSKQNIVSQENYIEVKDSIPFRGTKYLIRVPKNWNGILISDLDYRPSADNDRNLYLLKHGYALAGTTRRKERFTNYDPAHEIHDIISVLDIFESIFGKPKNVIQLGCSGGGTITLAMAEIHPDRIDGAIAACASTSPWMANTHLDALFVLKALIAPDLPIVNLPLEEPEISQIGDAWQQAIKNAQQTPEGRARIALAITIGQWAAWGGAGDMPVSEPNPNNTKDLQESMYESLRVLLPSKGTFGTTMLELSAPGQLRWNTGVDYKTSYANGDSLYQKAVEVLYKEAGLNLDNDLNQINAYPRIKADRAAIKWWSAPGRTHIGEPRVPLIRISTNGDGLVYPSMAQGYKELVDEKGYADLFRIAYVNRWGHCTFSLAEWLAAIETMRQRIETGVWPSTEPEILNKLGKSLDSKSTVRYYNYRGVKKYNRKWCPTVNDYEGKQE